MHMLAMHNHSQMFLCTCNITCTAKVVHFNWCVTAAGRHRLPWSVKCNQSVWYISQKCLPKGKYIHSNITVACQWQFVAVSCWCAYSQIPSQLGHFRTFDSFTDCSVELVVLVHILWTRISLHVAEWRYSQTFSLVFVAHECRPRMLNAPVWLWQPYGSWFTAGIQ